MDGPAHDNAGGEHGKDAEEGNFRCGGVVIHDGVHEADEGEHDGAVQTLVDVDEVGPVHEAGHWCGKVPTLYTVRQQICKA